VSFLIENGLIISILKGVNMGRPRKQTQSETVRVTPPFPPASPSPDESKPETVTAQPPGPSKAEAKTLTIRFGDDGKPLPLNEENRDRLRAATSDLLGELPAEVGPPPSIALEKLARHTVNAVNLGQYHLAARFTTLSLPDARKALKYTPEERQEIEEALIPVLDKRLAPWLRAHPDEYGLALILLAVSGECWVRAKELAEKKRQGGSDEHQH
jgi:hypothetical protein